jgi:hypothetical protein
MSRRGPRPRKVTRLTLLRVLVLVALARASYPVRVRLRAQHPGRRVKAVTA